MRSACKFFCPDWSENQAEIAEKRIDRESIGMRPVLDWLVPTIDKYRPVERVDQPAELGPVPKIVLHLCLELDERIGGRTQLDHEIRAGLEKAFLARLWERIKFRFANPGG